MGGNFVMGLLLAAGAASILCAGSDFFGEAATGGYFLMGLLFGTGAADGF